MNIAYICDRQLCPECSWPECTHTIDIEHAANFKPLDEKNHDYYWEVDMNDEPKAN